MPLSDFTLQDLRDATHTEILQGIHFALAPLSKKELCDWIWTVKDIIPTPITIETLTANHDTEGGQLLRIHEQHDILGNKIGSTRTDWTYYDTGEVDTIKTTQLDANDQVISTQTIKHFRDGKDPIIATEP